jgi:hypothetical protein
MNEGKIAVRYAKALFEAAINQGNLEKVRENVDSLQLLDSKVPGFRDLLESPILNTEQTNINSLNKLYVDLSRAKHGAEIYVNRKSEIINSFQKWQNKLSIKDFGVDEKALYKNLGIERIPKKDIKILAQKDDWIVAKHHGEKFNGRDNLDGTYDIYKDYLPKNIPTTEINRITKKINFEKDLPYRGPSF